MTPVKITHSYVYGTTDWFESNDVETYDVYEAEPYDERCIELHLVGTTTAPGQSVTLSLMRPEGEDTTVFWGDGSSDVIPDGGGWEVSHAYAAAGIYNITVLKADILTMVRLSGGGRVSGLDTVDLQYSRNLRLFELTGNIENCNVDSRHVRGWVPTLQFTLFRVISGTFYIDTDDMKHWNPQVWRLNYTPAGTYNIKSSDMTGWNNTIIWQLGQMPAGTYNIDSADMTGWTSLNSWVLWTMPAGTYNIDSADLASNSSIIDGFYLEDMPAGTYDIDSADMTNWAVGVFQVSRMPAGTYNINSEHFSNWNCGTFRLYSMPAGTYDIDTDDTINWDVFTFFLHSMPAGTYSFSGNALQTWIWAGNIQFQGLGLNQATVDNILFDVWAGRNDYGAGFKILDVSGSNAAPSGVHQAACPPTTGKEVAFELHNDSCVEGFNTWNVVDFTI